MTTDAPFNCLIIAEANGPEFQACLIGGLIRCEIDLQPCFYESNITMWHQENRRIKMDHASPIKR